MATGIGLYNPTTSSFFLKNTLGAGAADNNFQFGGANADRKAIAGDWDNQNGDSVGLYDAGTGVFYLTNDNNAGAADQTFRFGPTGQDWQAVAGDWDNQDGDSVGLYDNATGTFFLTDDFADGQADNTFNFGPAGNDWDAIAGDWDGDGDDDIGLYDAATGTFFLKNDLTAGPADNTFRFGPAGTDWEPVVGDWDNDEVDTVGLYDATTGTFFLTNDNTAGAADETFSYGPDNSGLLPLAGDWASEPPPPGQTFTLTEAIQTTNGTDGDDQFNAFTVFVAGSGQVNTLQSGDTVNGKLGDDTLTAQLIGGNVSPTLNSIENAEFTAFGAATVNLANSTGLTSLTVKDSTDDMTVSNAKGLVDLTVQNISGDNDVTLGYTAAALSGNTVQSLTLSGLSMADGGGDIQFNDSEGAGTIEQLDIIASGVANVDGIRDAGAVLDDLATVNVNATGETDLGVIEGAALTTFEASESTGNVKADLSKSDANDVTVTGGKGDDFITYGAGVELNKNDSIDLGDGDNTLAITGDAENENLDVTNVTTLQITTDGDKHSCRRRIRRWGWDVPGRSGYRCR